MQISTPGLRMSMPDSEASVFLTTSPALLAIPDLEAFVGAPVRLVRFGAALPAVLNKARGVLAWGRKPSARKAERLAVRLGLPLVRLEDGFLRSVLPGQASAPSSLVVDDLGIYYDASAPSRLETLIEQPLDEGQIRRARGLITRWRQARVSKYNHVRAQDWSGRGPFVLVVDQTLGDASITCGQADIACFHRMLRSALADYPELPVLLKTHPDVVEGRKQGHFSGVPELSHPRVTLVADNVHAPDMLEQAHAVYCVTSQMGFEALLWGRPVHLFGMPFYGGWGLTRDEQAAPERRRQVTLEQLVYGALVVYPRYLHPETGARCEAEALVDWLLLQREQRARFPGILYTTRWPRWKRPVLAKMLAGSQLMPVADEQAIPAGETRVVWGAGPAREPVLRLEDGFIRSVGLGADLIEPLSWVVDDLGMYYDATRPSRLEALLQSAVFEAPLLQRARALRAALVEQGVTKYNVGRAGWCRPDGQRVLLVPGQVESDASIRLGSPVVKSNINLLQLARESHPEDYIVYKPHPDVVAGLRTRGDGESDASQWCDEILLNQDMNWLLGQVDEVHTMTSLTGFEALLRGVDVVCYGQPFYAGWGLTQDRHPPERRTRKLTLDELVAATLILYPTYISRVSGQFATVETVMADISQARAATTRSGYAGQPSLRQKLSRVLRRAWRF